MLMGLSLLSCRKKAAALCLMATEAAGNLNPETAIGIYEELSMTGRKNHEC